mgnify:CR=1 FL=1
MTGGKDTNIESIHTVYLSIILTVPLRSIWLRFAERISVSSTLLVIIRPRRNPKELFHPFPPIYIYEGSLLNLDANLAKVLLGPLSQNK